MKDRKHTCENEDALVSYVYDELDAEARARVETHLASCEACRTSLDGLRGVRAQLATWQLPDTAGVGAGTGAAVAAAAGTASLEAGGYTDGHARGYTRAHTDGHPGGRRDRPHARPWWAPGALAAAAVIFLAIGAAIANLEITYGRDGIRVRTGWARAQAVSAQTAPPAASSVPAGGGQGVEARPVSAGDLAALERRLRGEFQALAASTTASERVNARAATAPVQAPGAPSAQVLQRVQALIDQSETRQRRELALRVAQVVRDFDSQRQSDLVRIQQGLGEIEGTRAADRQLLNYLVRTSQRQER